MFLREHARYYRHQIVGLKRRPTKTDDGQLFRDKHPEVVPKTYYKHKKQWHCEQCNLSMSEGFRHRHCRSKKHAVMACPSSEPQ